MVKGLLLDMTYVPSSCRPLEPCVPIDNAPAIVKCGSEAVFCSAQAVLSLRYRMSCVSAQGQHGARDQEEPQQTHRCAQTSAAHR